MTDSTQKHSGNDVMMDNEISLVMPQAFYNREQFQGYNRICSIFTSLVACNIYIGT